MNTTSRFCRWLALAVVIGGGGFLFADPPNQLPNSFFLYSNVTANQPGVVGYYTWQEANQRYKHSGYNQFFNWTGSTWTQTAPFNTFATGVTITCLSSTTGQITNMRMDAQTGQTGSISGNFSGCPELYTATLIINNPNVLPKSLTAVKFPPGAQVGEDIETWEAPSGNSTKVFGGFELNSCIAVVYGQQVIANWCFLGIEGGPSQDATITVDVPLGEQLDLTVSNPAENTSSVLVSIWSSVQGNIALGQTLVPGANAKSKYELVDGERIRVIIDGAIVWDYTSPTPAVGVVKVITVGENTPINEPDPDSAEPPDDPTPPTDPPDPTYPDSTIPEDTPDPLPDTQEPDPITPTPTPDPDPNPNPNSPLQSDTQNQVRALQDQIARDNAAAYELLKSMEAMQREDHDAARSGTAAAASIADDLFPEAGKLPSAEMIAGALPDAVKDALSDPSVTNPSRVSYSSVAPVDQGLGTPDSSWVIDVTMGHGPRRAFVDLNPLTNATVGPFVRNMAAWIRNLIMVIVTIYGTSLLYDQYYANFALLLAPRGNFRLGITANVGLADVITGVGTAVAGVAAGTITFGTAFTAAAGIITAALAKLVVPLLVHLLFLGVCIVTPAIALGAQGLMAPLALGNVTSTGSSMSLVDAITAIPSWALPALKILGAFVPVIFLATYWVGYLLTKRAMQFLTITTIGVQQTLGKS